LYVPSPFNQPAGSSSAHYFTGNIFCFINLLLIWEAVPIPNMPLSHGPSPSPTNCFTHQRVLVIAKQKEGKTASGEGISHMAHAAASNKDGKSGKTERTPKKNRDPQAKQNATATCKQICNLSVVECMAALPIL